MIEELIKRFKTIYEIEPTSAFFAPGRVNLIGEHIDYNGGHVFPCAINRGTYLLVHEREDQLVHFYSENFNEIQVEISLDDVHYDKDDDWANYPKGIFHILQENGYQFKNGLDLYFYGNIPNGAGLSSSASIEVVTISMLNDLFHLQIDPINQVQLAQQAENKFIGVNCGIMDQFICGLGKKDHALLLHTKDLSYAYVPLLLGDYALLIMNTNKRRGLQDSKYNERRKECEIGLNLIQQVLFIEDLCDLTEEGYKQVKNLIQDENIQKRVNHVVSENARTLKAKEGLEENDLFTFGKLMIESHLSLKEDYEVTGVELDTLVDLVLKEEGVLGARMTGAGFGGCAIALVHQSKLPIIKEKVEMAYEKIIGVKPEFYECTTSRGAHRLF